MSAFESKSACRHARQWYHDILHPEEGHVAPAEVVDHVQGCRTCQVQLKLLDDALSTGEEAGSGRTRGDAAIITMLRLHFAYPGKRVTCETVRPFLPSLCDSALEIRIPTPITVHVEHCPLCCEDLKTISELKLDRSRLYRLSQLLAEMPPVGSRACGGARGAIGAIVWATSATTDPGVLKHICTCPACRAALYDAREAMLRQGQGNEARTGDFPREGMSPADVFDYVVPYGIDPQSDQCAKLRESVACHLRGCPVCLSRIQELHRTIYGVVDRVESDVVTACCLEESADGQLGEEPGDFCDGFPLRVEVLDRHGAREPAATRAAGGMCDVVREKMSALLSAPLLKPALGVAIVLLVATALFFNVQTTEAISIAEIYRVLGAAQNVHIRRSTPDSVDPVQEIWASRSQDLYATKTGEQAVMWDLTRRTRVNLDSATGTRSRSGLQADDVDAIRRKMSGLLGLVPFESLSDMPPDTKWARLLDDELLQATDGVEIYELTWTWRSSDGSPAYRKWRVFVDSNSKLPQRTEYSCASAAGQDCIVRSIDVVDYPSDREANRVLRATWVVSTEN